MKRKTSARALGLLILAGLAGWAFMRTHRTTLTTELAPAPGGPAAGVAPAFTIQLETGAPGSQAKSLRHDQPTVAPAKPSGAAVAEAAPGETATPRPPVAAPPQIVPLDVHPAQGTQTSADRAQPDADSVVKAGGAAAGPRAAGTMHTAEPGDSVSKLAAALMGGDTKANRDAIINANPSLRVNPDLVVAGQDYFIPTVPPREP